MTSLRVPGILPEGLPNGESALQWASKNAAFNKKLPGKAKGAVRILPNLYLGNAQTAQDGHTLENLKITAVCSAGPKTLLGKVGKELGGTELKHIRLPVPDDDDARLYPYFQEAVEFIEENLRQGGTASSSTPTLISGSNNPRAIAGIAAAGLTPGRVLVHCRGGINRSCTVLAAYIVWKYGLSANESMTLVKEARPAARFGRGPDGRLQKDLMQWEGECLRGEKPEVVAALEEDLDAKEEGKEPEKSEVEPSGPSGGSDGNESIGPDEESAKEAEARTEASEDAEEQRVEVVKKNQASDGNAGYHRKQEGHCDNCDEKCLDRWKAERTARRR